MSAKATPAHLKYSYETMVSLFESQLNRFPGSRIKKDFIAGKMGRIWFNLNQASTPSAFTMQALQTFEGTPHIISYGCWLN